MFEQLKNLIHLLNQFYFDKYKRPKMCFTVSHLLINQLS